MKEVLNILEESKENIIINKKLTETSNELKEISAQLQHANQKLIKKDQQKDEFLDTVTHELRTPITAIRAATEILHDDDEIPEEMRKQFLQNIISESDRLNRLIDKILDLERLESGKQHLDIHEHNLVETIEKSLNPLQQLIANKNITLIKQWKSDVYRAKYDEERMIQVVTNLLSNAIKFCDETNGIIKIEVEKTSKNIILNIYNNGKTINADDLEIIFDKFYQSNDQNTKKPIGSGLGLAICKQIMEAHKGTIVAQNTNEGVEFMVKLPF